MSLNLKAFHDSIEVHAFPDSSVENLEKALEIISIVEYSDKMKVGEVDFSKFTVKQCEIALDEALNYYPDEYGDDEGENADNLINEINRIAHFKQTISKLKSQRKKRRFF